MQRISRTLRTIRTRVAAVLAVAVVAAPVAAQDDASDDAGNTSSAIVPVRLSIEEVRGTWKLSQNKPDDARLGAAAAIATGTNTGQELAALAELMRDFGRRADAGVDSGPARG